MDKVEIDRRRAQGLNQELMEALKPVFFNPSKPGYIKLSNYLNENTNEAIIKQSEPIAEKEIKRRTSTLTPRKGSEYINVDEIAIDSYDDNSIEEKLSKKLIKVEPERRESGRVRIISGETIIPPDTQIEEVAIREIIKKLMHTIGISQAVLAKVNYLSIYYLFVHFCIS